MIRLAHGGIGRVAVTVGALPAIFPINYAVLDGDIVFRTGPGTKLTAALAGAIVAFEIDHADPVSHSGWSVMVVGATRLITEEHERRRAAALPLASWAPGDGDVFIRIETNMLSGREIVHDALSYAGVSLVGHGRKGRR